MVRRGGVVNLLDLVFHVGYIIKTQNDDFDPNKIFTWQTWERIKDVFLLSAGDTYKNGATGGEAISSQLDCGNSSYGMQSGSTSYSDRSIVRHTPLSETHGEINAQISLMPPYKVVNVWVRTA